MIKIATDARGGSPPRVYFGLSHESLDRLRDGKPIRLDIDQCAMLGLGQREAIIYSGRDEIVMSQELEDHDLIPKGATERLRQEFAAHEQKKQTGDG